MGAEVSKAVKSDLEDSTLKELLFGRESYRMLPWAKVTEFGHYGKLKKRSPYLQRLPSRLRDGKQTLQPS